MLGSFPDNLNEPKKNNILPYNSILSHIECYESLNKLLKECYIALK